MEFEDITCELDYRASDGVEVWLLWRRADGTVHVRVDDAKSGEQFEVVVDGEQALDAFHHPFAYAA
jgi:hypothetical protein